MVHRGSAAHFIPSDVSRDVLVERRHNTIAPVFMEDVEFQYVTLDLEVVQRRHGVGVVASSAHHSAELVANLANDEVLFGRAYAKAQPHSDHVFLGQLRFPGPGLNVARGGRAHALLIDCHGGNRRTLGKSGHNDRQRVRSPGIFNESALEFAAACSLCRVTIRLP